MKKLISIIILGMFLISFVSSFSDNQLPQACGGDGELIIACFGDEQLTWLAGLLPNESLFTGFGMGAEYLTTPPEELPPDNSHLSIFIFSIVSFLGLEDDKVEFWGVMILMFILSISFIFIYKNRKKKRLLLLADDEEEEDEDEK